MTKLTKADIDVLTRATHPMVSTIRPWRGVYQRCWRLAREGYLIEAGISVMPPYKLYAITEAGRAALQENTP